MSAIAAAVEQHLPADFFKHCTWDNPVFTQGMFWIAVFIVTSLGTFYYKWKESAEAKEAEQKKQLELLQALEAKRRAAAEPRLIQPLAKPVEKKIEVPVVEFAQKAKKVPKEATKKRKPDPVQMVEQTPLKQQ